MYVVDSSSSYSNLTNLIGGKAANLHVLSNSGVAVPAWICTSSQAFVDHMAMANDEVSQCLAQVKYDSQKSVKKISDELQSIVKRLPYSPELVSEVEAKLGLIDGSVDFAVRSSALAEDTGGSSFAGLLDTYLHVPKSLIFERIKQCWASVFSERSLVYSHSKNISPLDNKVAVIIQVMINSQKSGVLFTADPNGNLDNYVVVAGYGLGEGIVANLVETDSYTINKHTGNVDTLLAVKNKKVVKKGDKEGGVELVDLAVEGAEDVLSSNELDRLIGAAKRIEGLYNSPQDIEWAMDEHGKLFITQSRPITTLGDDSYNIYDNSNVVESFPGITSALTFSVLKHGYETNLRNTISRFGIDKESIQMNNYVFKNLVGFIHGRVYYNLTNWFRVLLLIPGMKRFIIPVFNEMIGADQTEDNHHELSNTIRAARVSHGIHFAVKIVLNYLTLDRSIKIYLKNSSEIFQKYSKYDLEKMGLIDSAYVCQRYSDQLFNAIDRPLVNDFYAMLFLWLTKAFLKKSNIKNPKDTLNSLLAGENVESVKPVQSILSMAEYLRVRHELQETCKTLISKYAASRDICCNDDLYKAIESSDSVFFNMFTNHVEQYGDRSLTELKLETETFRERPVELLKTVFSYVDTNLSSSQLGFQENVKRNEVEKQILSDIGLNIPKRVLFKFLLRSTRKTLAIREKTRLDRGRLFGLLRTLLNQIAVKMQKNGLLQQHKDIYHLTFDEVMSYCNGNCVDSDLGKIVESRKMSEETYKKMHPVERITVKKPVYLTNIQQRTEYRSSGKDKELAGLGCSQGKVQADALVVKDPLSVDTANEKILVAETTDPGWVFLMLTSKGLISEKGSLLSHTAIIGRELGIPTIVGVKNATKIIKTGQLLKMDGQSGVIELQ